MMTFTYSIPIRSQWHSTMPKDFFKAVSNIFTGIELHPKTIADTLLDKIG